MKKLLILLSVSFFLCSTSFGQSQSVLNYSLNDTPNHGVNIKTKFPYIDAVQMPTVHIYGYSYGHSKVISLDITWYIYGGSYYNASISSSGSYTPDIYLTNNNGFVNIFIDDKAYYQRFTVSVYAQGMGEINTWFEGWTATDEPMSNNNVILVPYANKFAGNVNLPGNSIWNELGNVGIGTTNPSEKLSVNGKIRAKEVKVEASNWPDYVFQDGYKPKTLAEIEDFIKTNKHLPEVPSAKEVEKNGVALGEMNKILLKKIEELTLHLIEIKKEIQVLKRK